jgi:aromatic ring-opening dioxygenase catalytic subunit (LigB family)
MRELMMFPDQIPEWMQDFEDHLKSTLETEEPKKREEQLYSIMKHKTSRQNHPREEHLVPVAFAMAAAGGRGRQIYFSKMMKLMTAAQYEFDIDPSIISA